MGINSTKYELVIAARKSTHFQWNSVITVMFKRLHLWILHCVRQV